MRFDEAYFDRGIQRENTCCEKWDDRGILPQGGIPLWVADMDFPCAPAIEDAVKARAGHPCFGYPCDDPRDEEALRGFWLRRHQLNIQEGQSVMLPCVITGLKTCVRALTKEGEGVAVFTPVYGPFYESIRANGRQVVSIPLICGKDGVYRMDLNRLEEQLRQGVRLIMLCNPHNPVSRLWTREELTAIAGLAERYDAYVVSDEIHADFVYAPGVFTSILSLEKMKHRAVMLCSASKTFNIAGLQQASAVVQDEELAKRFRRELAASGAACGNVFARAGTQAAYTRCDDWLDGLLAYLDGSRALLADFVKEHLPRVRMTPVEATYLAWLDLRDYGKTCEELTAACRRNGVAFTPGTFFGQEGEGFLRVNFACPRQQWKTGMERLCRALKEEQ